MVHGSPRSTLTGSKNNNRYRADAKAQAGKQCTYWMGVLDMRHASFGWHALQRTVCKLNCKLKVVLAAAPTCVPQRQHTIQWCVGLLLREASCWPLPALLRPHDCQQLWIHFGLVHSGRQSSHAPGRPRRRACSRGCGQEWV